MPISRKIRCFAVPVLLVAVALNHGWRSLKYQQSSWGAGCGFGMFATVDYHGTRFCRATLTSGSVSEPAGFRSQFPDLDLRVRVLPSTDNLERYARALADRSWRVRSQSDLLPITTQGRLTGMETPVEPCFELSRSSADTLPIDTVDLAVWGIHFAPNERRIRAFPIHRVRVSK